jgi:type II secretory pathway predicted ATPase ExeA
VNEETLRRDPFGLSSDASLYLPRPAAEEALGQVLSYLRVGATQIALVGPDGIGKTLLLRVIASRLEGAVRVVDVPYPALPADEVASWVLNLMGVAPSPDPERTLVQRARQLREEGSGLVILLDDAVSTPLPSLRRLSRISREARPSLHIVMVLPDDSRSDEILAAVGPDIEVVRFAEPMSLDETRSYLEGRLSRASAPPELRREFTEDALDAIQGESEGIPAEVNRAARRQWTQLTGFADRPPPEVPPPDAARPDDRATTALGSALLANATAIDLTDPFQEAEEGEESAPTAPPSEAPTELLELPEPAAAKPPPVPAPAPRPVAETAPPPAAAPRVEPEPPQTAPAARRRRPWRVALWVAASIGVVVAFTMGRWTAETVPLHVGHSSPPTEATPLAARPAPPPVERAPAPVPPRAEPSPAAAPEPAPPLAEARTPVAEATPQAEAAAPSAEAPQEVAAAPEPEAAPDVAAPPPALATTPAPTPAEAVEASAGDATEPTSAESDAGTASETILVSINAVPWARIEIDGADAGLTPLADWPLEPGQHQFRAIFGDGREVVRTETIDPLNRRILFR